MRDSSAAPLDAPTSVARDDALLAAIRRGDAAAFRQFYDAYAPALLRFATHVVASASDAEDVVHDVFLWCWTHRAELDIRGDVRIYLFAAVRRRALHTLRHERVVRAKGDQFGAEVAGVAAAPGTAADTALDADAMRAVIERALMQLSETQRRILLLRWREGLGYRDIAHILGTSTDAAKQQVSRLQRALRPLLERFRLP